MAEEKKMMSWQVPSYGSPREKVLEFAKQQLDNGIERLQAEPGFEQLEQAIRIISGRPTDALAEKQRNGYSKVQTNRLKRNLREMVNSLSDITFTPGFHSDANEMQDKAELLNRVAYSWYITDFIDVKTKKAIQWMAISPRGWLEICYRQIPGKNKKVIDAIPHSAFDVVMTGVPESGDHQEAYTVTLIKDFPMYLAHSLFPDFQSQLKPDGETPKGWWEKTKALFDTAVNDVFATEPEKMTAKDPTCRIYYQYVLDLSINRSGKTMYMGYAKDASGSDKMMNGERVKMPWSYDVPSVGQPIPTGYDTTAAATYRYAKDEDCRIFPGRRLIIFRRDVVLYDGPMFDWHGMVPLVKFTADSWPGGIEFSMVHDVAPIHDAIQEIERIIHQTVRNRFKPSMLFNIRALTRDKAKSLNTETQGQRIGYNGNEAQGENIVRPLLPAGFNTIEAWIENFQKHLTESEDYQMGVRDVSALAKLKVGASQDSMEKMMELAGPIVKGISRDMERSFRDFSEMYKYMVFQYETTPRLMQIVGVDGVTPESIDYQPGNLIPSHMPGEVKDKPSVFSEMQRAKWMAEHLPFMITPNTLHQIVQTQMKLLYLQLFRMGFPISPWTLATVLHIPNFGKVPDGCNTEIEKYHAWKKMELEFQASLSKEAQELMGGEGGEGNAPGLGPKGGNKGTGGRPPSGQAMPRSAQKGDGRPYIRESK